MLEQNGDDDNVLGAEVSILPPANTGDDTDGDSGDEELLSCGNPNSLNRNQLMADAAVKLRKPGEDVTVGIEEDDESANECEPAKKVRKHLWGKQLHTNRHGSSEI